MRAWLIGAVMVAGCANETICATPSAVAVEPDIQTMLEDAVAYWERQGVTGLTVVDGSDCDIPVKEGPATNYARAWVTSPPYADCEGQFLNLRSDTWPEVQRDGVGVRILAHEIGHLYCFDESDEGVMSSEWRLPEFETEAVAD